MTRPTPEIPALRTSPLRPTRESAHGFARDAGARAAKALLTAFALLFAITLPARATTYYIDYASGSNSNNGTSKATPWKSHPYMQNSSSCAGAPHSYSHVVGDQFIFKGGVTWPAACLEINAVAGGTTSTQDYYGVDLTWYTGGSFTRPVFDAAQTVLAGDHFFYLASSGGYITIDNIEMKNQNIGSLSFGAAEAIYAGSGIFGVVLNHLYIHDFMTTLQMSDALGSTDYSAGGIQGYVTLLNSVIDDTNGFGFDSVGTKITGGNIGGACQNCREVSNTKFVADVAACFGVTLCHDSEFTGINQSIQDAADPNGHNLHDIGPKFARKHSQAIEDENEIGGYTVYNNWVHDNAAGIYISVGYKGSQVYNNVLNNNSGGPWPIEFATTGSDTSATRGYGFNNTVDCNGSGTPPTGLLVYNGHTGIAGQLILENNLVVNCPGGFFQTSATGTVTQSHNYLMGASEATTYGFIAANKYSPASSDPNVSGQALNLSSSCSGGFAELCQDTKGAVWFGSAYVSRPTGSTAWDLGAYEFQGGATGPPAVTITAPANNATVSGSISLTASCTPQGSATVGSIQFEIDGTSFGSAGASSPYTLSWNTLTTANASHTISATCTDSNSQTGTASAVTVTVSNSMPGCFVSGSNTNWNSYQAFTAQTTNFTATFTATPNTNNQDSVIALSQAPITAYSQGAALIRFNSSGQIDVYKGSLGDYTADIAVSYTAGATYAFTLTVNMSAGTYTVALTSPSSVTLATGYTFRATASAASLGYINAVSDNTTPDTAEVCNFQIGSAASLTFSPASLSFGNVTVGGNTTQTITATTSGGSVSFTSVAIGGNADFTINSNACTGSIPSSCTTQIEFAPTAAALETATVTYTDGATGSPQSVAVSGTGVPATPTLSVNPASVNFGSVQVHVTSSSGPIVLTIASGPVTFTGTPSLSGANAADFALASNTCTGTVSAASCQTVVSFTPSAVGSESATLSYTDDATGSPQSVPLSGTGYLAPHPPTAVHATVQ